MSIEERYKAAIAYVHRAVATVERRAFASSLVDWYAARNLTEPVRDEAEHVEARWLRATNELDRARVARDTELLADRTQESLPGAPQDRRRTNLWDGEIPAFTPPITYGDEVARQAHDAWDWTKNAIRQTANDAASLGTWLLIAGGVLLTAKLWRKTRQEGGNGRRVLNRRLERLAADSERT